MAIKKVRFALRVPGLLLVGGGALALAACDGGKSDRKPAAEVVLTDAATVDPSPPVPSADAAEAPGFGSIAEARPSAPPAAQSNEQAVTGTIVDFLCNPDTPVSSDDVNTPAACELIIRTEARGDRRMLCDVAPCDAWAARGNLPRGIRGLQAEAWISLVDTFDISGRPTGRVAKVKRLNLHYTKPKG